MTVQKEKIDRTLRVLVPRVPGLSFYKGLERALENKRIISSNTKIAKLLQRNKWEVISEGLACWTGTMTAYEKPNEKFKDVVEYEDPQTHQRWVFRLPYMFSGEKNAIVVTEYPDYKVERDGKTIVIHPRKATLIINFPTKNGWYIPEKEHGIPIGKEVDKFTPNAIYLFRGSERVGPVCRGAGRSIRYMDLETEPSYPLGMIVEKGSHKTHSSLL